MRTSMYALAHVDYTHNNKTNKTNDSFMPTKYCLLYGHYGGDGERWRFQ